MTDYLDLVYQSRRKRVSDALVRYVDPPIAGLVSDYTVDYLGITVASTHDRLWGQHPREPEEKEPVMMDHGVTCGCVIALVAPASDGARCVSMVVKGGYLVTQRVTDLVAPDDEEVFHSVMSSFCGSVHEQPLRIRAAMEVRWAKECIIDSRIVFEDWVYEGVTGYLDAIWRVQNGKNRASGRYVPREHQGANFLATDFWTDGE